MSIATLAGGAESVSIIGLTFVILFFDRLLRYLPPKFAMFLSHVGEPI